MLSNLGLSYVLSKDLPKAEETLRQAYASTKADARVRQNLGLVVGLQGRFAEAETIVKADLPPDEAAANVAYLKQMLNRKDNPRAGAGAMPMASLNRPTDRSIASAGIEPQHVRTARVTDSPEVRLSVELAISLQQQAD